MARIKGNSLLETRRLNRILIKNQIFHAEYITRTEIANRLGLTLPTITTSVNEMMEEGILEENPIPEEYLINVAGRTPTAISFVANAASAIGVELGPYAIRAVLINMHGDVLSSLERDAVEDYDAMLSQVAEMVAFLRKNTTDEKLLGLGVGLPGFVDWEKGIIRSNPRSSWNGRALAKDLTNSLNLPVFIDNNVRLRAVGYQMEEKGLLPDIFAYLFVSRGISCPLMV